MVNLIERDELYRLLGEDSDLVLVEVLGEDYYADAHLPGAVNIPPWRIDRVRSMIEDLDTRIVVYCSGIGDHYEWVAAQLEGRGYRNVSIYVGGKEDWVEAGLPVDRCPQE